MLVFYLTIGHNYSLLLILCQEQNKHVDRVVANVTLKRYVDTALFNVFLIFSKSISICKPWNYLGCLTSKGKGPQILDVLATLASQTRVTL